MWMRDLAGYQPDAPIQLTTAGFLLQHLPVWNAHYSIPKYEKWRSDPRTIWLNPDDIANFWYWYYGTLAFRQRGPKMWHPWSQHIKNLLLEHQRRGGLEDGSWDPIGAWARVGGRTYSTTFLTLTLQSFYAYELLTK
jgi:hypothetical protein